MMEWLRRHEENDNRRWEQVEGKIDRALQLLEGDGADDSKPGLRVKVDRLEQAQRLQGRALKFVAGGGLTAFGTWLFERILRHTP